MDLMALSITVGLALLFVVIGIFLFLGKGSWLIAGYNTMPREEKEAHSQKG